MGVLNGEKYPNISLKPPKRPLQNLPARFSFSELECLVVSFWSHVPGSLSNLLYTRAVVSVVALCDSVLYKAAVKAVLPSPSLPGSLSSSSSSNIIILFRW